MLAKYDWRLLTHVYTTLMHLIHYAKTSAVQHLARPQAFSSGDTIQPTRIYETIYADLNRLELILNQLVRHIISSCPENNVWRM